MASDTKQHGTLHNQVMADAERKKEPTKKQERSTAVENDTPSAVRLHWHPDPPRSKIKTAWPPCYHQNQRSVPDVWALIRREVTGYCYQHSHRKWPQMKPPTRSAALDILILASSHAGRFRNPSPGIEQGSGVMLTVRQTEKHRNFTTFHPFSTKNRGCHI